MQFVESLMIARQRGCKIETESIDMNVQHPVTQAVGHQLQRARTEQSECVTRAGEIQIRARILRMQPVVTGVIDPTKAERWAARIAGGGMIVNEVQNHSH